MLKGLDQVNWHQLQHAYGPADDIPELISSLTVKGRKIRKRTLEKLYSTIYCQGMIYQASAYAVPFIIGLLKEKSVPHKVEIVMLLEALATGNSSQNHYSDEQKQDLTLQLKIEKEKFWADRTHEAIREGIDTYLYLLKHKNTRVRMSVISLLAWIQLDASLVIPPLQSLFQQETDQCVKACIILTLGRLSQCGSKEHQQLIQLVTGAETDLLKLVASMAVIRMKCDEATQQATDILLETIALPKKLSKLYSKVLCREWGLVFDATQLLESIPSYAISSVIDRLAPLLVSLNRHKYMHRLRADKLAEALLNLTFKHVEVEDNVTVESLTDEQRLVLTAIAQSDAIWDPEVGNEGFNCPLEQRNDDTVEKLEVLICRDMYELLKLNLPHKRRDLRAFLQMEPNENDDIRLIVTDPPDFDQLLRLNPQYTRKQLRRICDESVLWFQIGDI